MSFILTSNVFGGAILQYGETALGINDEGHLNIFGDGPDGTNGYGVWRIGTGDATYPGCLCEGWGVAVTTASGTREAGHANRNEGFGDFGGEGGEIGTGVTATSEERGAFGLQLNSFSTDSATATSSVSLTGAPVTVNHVFGGSLANDVFQVQVTITNNSATEAVGDVVYRRAMDWDVPPTEFNEYVTHGGIEANLESVGGNVRYASDNGFASTDPRLAAGNINIETENVDFVDNGPDDHGSVFDFAFGDLAAGESRVFNIYYGSAATEVAAMDAITTLGADVYSLGQSSTTDGPSLGTPATFIFAFGGVGGVEPGSEEATPILPFVNEFEEFIFPDPTPRRWFDPPFVEGFTYTLEGGAKFTQVGGPTGFGTLIVLDDMGNEIGSLTEGSMFDLTGFNLSQFSLVGIDPLLDKEDPGYSTAFPTFLDWSGVATSLTMVGIETSASVPAPNVLALVGIGLLGLVVRRPRKKLN